MIVMSKILHGEKTLPTVSYARATANWALSHAQDSPGLNQKYALITANVFTAFMVEGTLSHIGALLFHDWYKPKKNKEAAEDTSLTAKHGKIRSIIHLNDYPLEETKKIIKELKEFRDSFAHPKVRSENFSETYNPESLNSIPLVGWEKQLDLEIRMSVFERLENYCEQLCHKAADFLESYPHKKL